MKESMVYLVLLAILVAGCASHRQVAEAEVPRGEPLGYRIPMGSWQMEGKIDSISTTPSYWEKDLGYIEGTVKCQVQFTLNDSKDTVTVTFSRIKSEFDDEGFSRIVEKARKNPYYQISPQRIVYGAKIFECLARTTNALIPCPPFRQFRSGWRIENGQKVIELVYVR